MSSRRNFIANLAKTSAGLALWQIPQNLLASEDLIRLSVLHTNDIHCRIDSFPETNPSYPGKGGLARLSGIIETIRSDNNNVLLLDAGDMFQGTPYFNYYKGEVIFKVMSEMGYDGSTIGNHEFDNGLEGINNVIDYPKFPIINSNYDFSQTQLYDRFPEYVIYRKEGVKIGIYGLGIELEGLVTKEKYGETIYHDPVSVALNTEAFLKKEKQCDLVVCLSHLGISYDDNKVSDRVIASQTHFTDLIIGGHTHTFLDEPLQLKNAEGKRIIVNQAGWGGMVLGRIDFLFDKTKKESPLVLSQNINAVS